MVYSIERDEVEIEVEHFEGSLFGWQRRGAWRGLYVYASRV